MTTAPQATTAVNPTAIPVTGVEASVSVATDPKLGKILVDGKGMTLYGFTKDEPDKSNCSGGCLESLAAAAQPGQPQGRRGVDQSLLGTTTLADGSKIVTYNHMPAVPLGQGPEPGDVTGQNVNNVWFVVSPDGKMVGEQPVPATGYPRRDGSRRQRCCHGRDHQRGDRRQTGQDPGGWQGHDPVYVHER